MYQLVTIAEPLFSDCLRTLLSEYPKKLGSKRRIPLAVLFGAGSLDEAYGAAISAYLNELSYITPRDYAESVEHVFSFNLLAISNFHKYVELKATRDIYVHNQGIANETYVNKAGSHARVQSGHVLPIDLNYFWESHETCLGLTEAMMQEFHAIWPSQEYVKALAETAAKRAAEVSLEPPPTGAPEDT